jgi:hypothetical protein
MIMRYTRSLLAIAASLWLVGAGVAAAQYTGTDKPATGADKRSPAVDKTSPGSDRGSMRTDKPMGTDRTSTRTDTVPMAAGQMIGEHSTQGEITKLDQKQGWVNVKTSEGTMIVKVPPASLQGLKKGDTITVHLAMKSNGQPKAR